MRCEHCERTVTRLHPFEKEKLCYDCFVVAIRNTEEFKHKKAWQALKRRAQKERE